jgi:hypothetical protein
MNVKKATLLFSTSVAMVLNHYRNLKETADKFKGW